MYLSVYSQVRQEQLSQQFGRSIFRSNVLVIAHNPCPPTCVFSEGMEGRKIGLTSKSNKATGLRCSASGSAPADRAQSRGLLVVSVDVSVGGRMTGGFAQHRVAVCLLTRYQGGHTWLWWWVSGLSLSAMGIGRPGEM